MGARQRRRTALAVSAGVAGGMWLTALLAWRAGPAPAIFFAYLGVALGAGLGYYLGLAPARRIRGRRVVIGLVGAGMLAAALGRSLLQGQLVQVEGLFFELLSGALQAAALHYAIAKLAGPLIFGRAYCGWACWTAAALDFLPHRTSPGRLGGWWPRLRYIHLVASAALVALLWYGFAYRMGPAGALGWFLAGNAAYYAAGVGLALWLRDNRAFCKYLCPAGVLALPAAPRALLKVATDPARCNRRGECTAACPMDVRVSDYVQLGERVTSAECIACQACLSACPEGALTLSLGGDPRRRELIRLRED